MSEILLTRASISTSTVYRLENTHDLFGVVSDSRIPIYREKRGSVLQVSVNVFFRVDRIEILAPVEIARRQPIMNSIIVFEILKYLR